MWWQLKATDRVCCCIYLRPLISSKETGSQQHLKLCKCPTNALEYEEKFYLTLKLKWEFSQAVDYKVISDE